MKVELPDEVVEFMAELAREIKTQDNRATASPYFYVIRGDREMVAPSGYGDGETYYYSSEWERGHTRDEWEDIIKQHNEENYDNIDIDDFIVDKCEEFGMHEVATEENVFFTEKGLKEHMKLNGHNYRHYKNLLPLGYVKFAFRNPEIEKLMDCIMAFENIVKETPNE